MVLLHAVARGRSDLRRRQARIRGSQHSHYRAQAGTEDRIDASITATVTSGDARLDTTRSEWLDVFDINVVSCALATKKGPPYMHRRGSATDLSSPSVRINAVSRVWTCRRDVENRYGSRQRADGFTAELQRLDRITDPEEVVAAEAFLLSPAARSTSGSELLVDGCYSSIGPEGVGRAAAKVPPIEEPQ